MHIHIARQPIFNRFKRLHAYELLFRGTAMEEARRFSGDRATSSLLSSAFLTEGIERIAGNRPCFINFTENLIVRRVADAFPKTKMVVEVLEDVRPLPKVIQACRELKEEGYTIALDDFVYHTSLLPLVEVADIIKVDYRLNSSDEVQRIMYRLAHYDLQFLAEKVETYEEFEHALQLGFTYFQGYFFSRPERLQITEVESVKTNLINLLAEVNRKSTTVDRLETVIGADLAISYKLLRYINSATFYLLSSVDSIRQAIVYLGEREIRRFVTLVIISELAADKPAELVRLSIVRARFCEKLAEHSSIDLDGDEAFLLGLFSLIDGILDTSMKSIMDRLPLGDRLKEALLDHAGPYHPLMEAIRSYEQGEADCTSHLSAAGIGEDQVCTLYLDAVKYAEVLP